jgi:hypothetical protein
MTEFKGAKGKWHVVSGSIDKLGNCLSIANTKQSYNGRELICVITTVESLNQNDISNALLISKAPEMLEMLESCLLAFQQLGMKEPKGIKELIKEATTI